jgi:hypothetical protein
MLDKMKPLQMAAAVIAALATIIGGAYAVDSHFARKAELAEVSKAVQSLAIESSIDRTNDRLWDTEDRLKDDPKNVELQKKKRELEDRKRRLEQQQIQLDKGGS